MKKILILLSICAIVFALSSCSFTYKNLTATAEYNVKQDYLYFTQKIDSPGTKLVAGAQKLFGKNLKITGVAGKAVQKTAPVAFKRASLSK